MLKRILSVLMVSLMIVGCSAQGNMKTNSLDGHLNKAYSFNFKKKTVKLNSGYSMPILGLGTWMLTNKEAENSVYHALQDGYRLIDTAEYYGDEKGVGKGVRKAIKAGIVKRSEVFVTTKIMPDAYDNPSQAIKESNKTLGLGYIDLMLIHQPGDHDRAVYRAMEKAVKQKTVRSIGISNYYTKKALDEVLKYAKITPAVIQNENHLTYQNTKLKKYARKYGIVLESWYPLGGRGHVSENLNNKVVKRIAKKHRKTSAQVILRWQLQAGYIAIPGSSNPKHIKENYNIFDFKLSTKEMSDIDRLNTNTRYENW